MQTADRIGGPLTGFWDDPVARVVFSLAGGGQWTVRMGRSLVLMYHGATNGATGVWDIGTGDIRRHVQAINGMGVRCTSVGAAVRSGDPAAAISFDDAYASVYEVAWPVLDSLGVTGTVFVPVNYVGGLNAYDCLSNFGPRQPAPLMTWSQLRELAAAGWSIQSHGCSHFPVAVLGREYLEDDLRRSRMTIEDRLGCEVTGFAYPFGIAGGAGAGLDVEVLLQECGYQFAVLADGGWFDTPSKQPYLVPRYPARSGDSLPLPATE